MAEILRFANDRERLLTAAEMISQKAVDLVAEKYGTGYVHTWPPAQEKDLAYHNMQHTMQVRYDSQYMAEALELNTLDTALVRMAASAHDIVQLKGRGQMEYESAMWLEQEMRQAGFCEDDIVAAGLAILGTEPLINSSGVITGQKASIQQYPSERARLIALSVACGDMGGLYAPHGPMISRDIYKESRGVASTDDPGLEGLVRFQDTQLDLLRRYRFPHPVGEELFAELRPDIIAYQTAVTYQVANGIITKWAQLVAQDADFCNLYP